MKKITFLLGAGASFPFLFDGSNHLSTKYITERILDKKCWEKVLKKYENSKNNIDYITTVFNVDEVLKILNEIIDKLKSSVYFNNINFESIIHLFDKICDYFNYNNSIENGYGNIDEILIDLFGDDKLSSKNIINSNFDTFNHLPYLIREIICDSILEIWNGIKDLDNQLKINKNYYNKIIDDFESVNIYSLNYDPLLYESLYDNKKITTGFNNNIFNSETFFSEESKNILAFIHGHIGFEPIGNEMRFNKNYKDAISNRFKGLFNNYVKEETKINLKGMKGNNYNTFLITGFDKFDAFINKPFSSYIHRFSKDIIDSDIIILIGLSLNDYHLNSFLTNALYNFGHKKIIFVTSPKKPDEIIETLKDFHGDNLLLNLIKNFEDVITTDYNNHLNTLLAQLKSDNFGKLSKNITLYINGTEGFYNEKDLNKFF